MPGRRDMAECDLRSFPRETFRILARPEGVEPPTEEVEAPCSIQLSYGRARGLDSGNCAGRKPSS